MYNFPGYVPNPHHPRQAPTAEPPAIPANVRQRALNAGATHISPDGRRAYARRCGNWYEMRWLSTEWGSWWTYPGEPEGVVGL